MGKNSNGTKLLFLAVGAVLGAAVGYIAASEKKEEWIRDIHGLVDRIKGNAKASADKPRETIGKVADKKTDGDK